MLIAQISDCHLTVPGGRAYGRVDTHAMLERTLETLKTLPRRPDLVLATGDLAADGQGAEYAAFLALIAGLDIPLLPVVGNHDDRAALAEAFCLDRWFKLQPGFVQYVVDGYPVRLLILDSVTEGSAQPGLCPDRLAWIEARLAEDDRPALIAMHHPPFPAGVAWMEARDLAWAAPLARLAARHPRVVRVVCGHLHRSMTAAWASTVAMSAPSTAHQVFLDMAPSPVRQFSFEAAGFLLHQWTGAQMISYGVAVPGFADTFPVREG